jgi:hypothetical protein
VASGGMYIKIWNIYLRPSREGEQTIAKCRVTLGRDRKVNTSIIYYLSQLVLR